MSETNYTTEIWIDIKDYEGRYQISNMGRVKSLKRLVRKRFKKKKSCQYLVQEIIMSPGIDNRGYEFVNLSIDGLPKKHMIHRLVLEAFVGPRVGNLEGCHNNGNPRDNKVTNLRWDTHKNNHQDRIKHGTNNYGTKNGSAKLTEDDVRKMRKLYSSGKYTMEQLSYKFGLAKNSARRIIIRETWKHID